MIHFPPARPGTRRPGTRLPGLMLTALMGCLGGCLFGCSGPRVAELPPAHYSIAGVWELNTALSSDTDKILAALQPKPRTGPGSGKGAGHGPGGSRGGQQPAPEVINDPTTDLPPVDTSNGGRGGGVEQYYRAQNDRNAYRPPLDFQKDALLGGQWLKIQQSDSEVRIVNAARTRSYTPGQRSVVSVPSGVADQVAGWSGRNFRVYLHPQIGPTVQETYSLSADGRQLSVKIEVASEGRNRAIKVLRIYDRSTRDPAALQQTLEDPLPPAD